jgi:hypothetical protein
MSAKTTPKGFNPKDQGRRYSGAPWETIREMHPKPQRGFTTQPQRATNHVEPRWGSDIVL